MTRRSSLLLSAALPALTFSSELEAAETPRPAQSLSFTALDGRKVSLEQLRGSCVMMFFFSTDCGHCQKAATEIAPVYSRLRSQGFEILGLALNPTAKDNLPNFVKSYGVEFPVSLTTQAQFRKFAGMSVMARFYYPYLMFVDRNGVIQAEHQGADRAYFADLPNNLMKTLSPLLAEKAKG